MSFHASPKKLGRSTESPKRSMILGRKTSRAAMAPIPIYEEDINAVLNLCYMKHVAVDSEEDIQTLKHAKRRQQKQTIVNAVRRVPPKPALLLQHGSFYGDYCPPNLPPVQSLHQFIQICSKPFEKQLTDSDVREDQARLAMHKEDVEKHLMPLLNENEHLKHGIHVTTYDLDGRAYPMVFKTWVDKIHVLTTGWKAFYKAHKLVEKQDFVTVWMFRNALTGNLCFVIIPRRLPVFEAIKRSRTRHNMRNHMDQLPSL